MQAASRPLWELQNFGVSGTISPLISFVTWTLLFLSSRDSTMSRVVITGGTGFLGQLLARAILRRGSLLTHGAAGASETTASVREVILADVAKPSQMLFDSLNTDAQLAVGDVSDAGYCNALLGGADGPVSIFHLGAIMSGAGEADFDRCMDVNLRGTMHLLEAARNCGAPRPRFIMTSAGATLGAGAPTDFVTKDDAVADSTRATPHTTYGMTKACAELLVADYSRKGFVDGRGLRLPSVIVRAGQPNGATTSCFSSVLREPLAGKDTTSPVGPHVEHAVTSHRVAVDCLLNMHELPAADVDAVLGFDRTVFVPSVAVSLSQLETALKTAVAPTSHAALGKVSYDVDETLSKAVASFPTKVDSSRAEKLNLSPDAATSLDPINIIKEYVEDFPDAIHPDVKLSGDGVAAASAAAAAGPEIPNSAVCLITGGGTGIGRAVAVRLAEGGWQEDPSTPVALVLTGRRKNVLEEAAAEIEEAAAARGANVSTLVHPADLTSESEVRSLFAAVKAKYGRVDVLFNNAGANVPPTTVEDMSYKDWRMVVGINLDAAFHVAREAYVMMKEQTPQGGRIINNGSISADRPRPGSIAYTASKHAITGLTKSISLDGRPHSIACGQIDYGNVVSAISAGMAVGMPQADGSVRPEPRMSQKDAADAVHYMAQLPLSANVLQMTVMATNMPLIGRG